MNTSALGLIVVVLAFAALPIWFARSRDVLFASDIALLILPPLAFWASGSLLNPAWRSGLGEFVYPFVALALCVALLYARVFLLDRLRVNPQSNSMIALVGTFIVAVVVGFVVPPLYE